MDDRLWIRFETLRRSVFDFIRKKVKEGAYHKSYEGAFRLEFTFPNCFEDLDCAAEPKAAVRLSSTLLFPENHVAWTADSFELALTIAEKEIYGKIDAYETQV